MGGEMIYLILSASSLSTPAYLNNNSDIINMSNTVSKHISIKEYQERYLNENHINLSSLVQEKLDEEISDGDKEQFREKDNKTTDESGSGE